MVVAQSNVDYKQGADDMYKMARPIVDNLYTSQGDAGMTGMMSMMRNIGKWVEKYTANIKQEDGDIFMNVMLQQGILLPICESKGSEAQEAQKAVESLKLLSGKKHTDRFYQLLEQMNTKTRLLEFASVFDTIKQSDYTDNDLLVLSLTDGMYRTVQEEVFEMANNYLRAVLFAPDKANVAALNRTSGNWVTASDELYRFLSPLYKKAFLKKSKVSPYTSEEYIIKWLALYSDGITPDDIEKMGDAQFDGRLPLPDEVTEKTVDKLIGKVYKNYSKGTGKLCSKLCMQTTKEMLTACYKGTYTPVMPTLDASQYSKNDMLWLATLDAMLRAMYEIKQLQVMLQAK